MEKGYRKMSGIKYPEQNAIHAEFFAPGELLAIKSQGETLIDPLPILARFGIEVNERDRNPLITILASHNPGLNFIDTEEGTRIYAKDIEELIKSSSNAVWEIATKLLPKKTRDTFFQELQTGLERAYQQMVADEKIRQGRLEKDWQK